MKLSLLPILLLLISPTQLPASINSFENSFEAIFMRQDYANSPLQSQWRFGLKVGVRASCLHHIGELNYTHFSTDASLCKKDFTPQLRKKIFGFPEEKKDFEYLRQSDSGTFDHLSLFYSPYQMTLQNFQIEPRIGLAFLHYESTLSTTLEINSQNSLQYIEELYHENKSKIEEFRGGIAFGLRLKYQIPCWTFLLEGMVVPGLANTNEKGSLYSYDEISTLPDRENNWQQDFIKFSPYGYGSIKLIWTPPIDSPSHCLRIHLGWEGYGLYQSSTINTVLQKENLINNNKFFHGLVLGVGVSWGG